MGTIIVTSDPQLIEFLDTLVDADLDYSGEEYDSYWCINIRPFVCENCGNIVAYAQCGEHFIIIWENQDDEAILETAKLLQSDGSYDPRIVKYNRILGPCIEFNTAIKLGIINRISHGT